jgi:flagellum-specific ATP synthase
MSADLVSKIKAARLFGAMGQVTQFFGLVIEANGPDVFLGERCYLRATTADPELPAEVIGLKGGKVLLMPLGEPRGIRKGSEVTGTGLAVQIPVGEELLGRVIDPFGQPLDDKGPLHAAAYQELSAEPLNPLQRRPIQRVLETGVRAIDSFLTIGRGQRVGIFSGSGVGKSTLLGMIARNVSADVNVIALIGERGREVPDFVRSNLGEAGLKRSVVVVATSDQSALMRSHAAFAATAIAEFFRARGQDVLLTMDSVTRFAMARREIGLAVGEPPTARGYTPSVFAMLPKLMERAGAAANGATITALYTVLVEGDDMNEPVADHVRSIVDGHIVLSRKLANETYFPAIDVLQSNSRLANTLRTPEQNRVIHQAQRWISLHRESKDMLDLGAYQSGSNAELDRAIAVMPKLKAFLCQNENERAVMAQAFAKLVPLLSETAGGA